MTAAEPHDSPPPSTNDGGEDAGAAAASAPTPREPIAWIVLEDIQGLFGGHALYVWPDGRMMARVVQRTEAGQSPGLRERRYEGRLSEEQLSELSALLAAQDFTRLVVPERPGIPDEARAEIRVRWQSGQMAQAGKWEGQRVRRFEEVQGWLMGRVRTAAAGRPAHEGAYDYRYRPKGPWTASFASR